MAGLALRQFIQLLPILGSPISVAEEELISFIQFRFPVGLWRRHGGGGHILGFITGLAIRWARSRARRHGLMRWRSFLKYRGNRSLAKSLIGRRVSDATASGPDKHVRSSCCLQTNQSQGESEGEGRTTAGCTRSAGPSDGRRAVSQRGRFKNQVQSQTTRQTKDVAELRG